MKDENEKTGFDAEQLLREKSWEQLTVAELKFAEEAFSGRSEYERMRVMVHRLRSSAGNSDAELVPAPYVRTELLNAFDDEQKRRRALWWNSLGFRLRDRLRFDIPAVRYALAGIVLFAGIFTVVRLLSDGGNNEVNTIAVNNIKPDTTALRVDSVSHSALVSTPQVVPGANSSSVKHPINQEQDEKPNFVQSNPEPPLQLPAPAPVIVQNSTSPDSSSIAVTANRVIDTTGTPIAVTVLTGGDPAICCGASTLFSTSPTMNATASFTWTSTLPATVNVTGVTYAYGQAANARSLSNDLEVLDVFFSLK